MSPQTSALNVVEALDGFGMSESLSSRDFQPETFPHVSYGLGVGWGGPIGGCCRGLGGTFKDCTITLVQSCVV